MMDIDQKAFEEVCRPVIEWINDNTHPHSVVIINCVGAELFSGEIVMKDDSFIKG